MKRTPLKRTTPLRAKKPEPRKKETPPMCAFPKPGAIKIPKGAVKVFPDGREVCQVDTKAGWEEYKRRVKIMHERQGKMCGLQISPQCKERGGRLLLAEATFEHSAGRGSGGFKRDDRCEDSDSNPMNMAVCQWCNCLKGSRPMSDFEGMIP